MLIIFENFQENFTFFFFYSIPRKKIKNRKSKNVKKNKKIKNIKNIKKVEKINKILKHGKQNRRGKYMNSTHVFEQMS